MADFTTGEAVSLQLPIARIPMRAAAFAIDLVLQLVLGLLLLLAVFGVLFQFEPDTAWLDTAALLTMVTVLVGYPVVCETAMRGRTVGKLALGLRVVRGDGGPIDFRHALTRGLSGALVDFWNLGGFGVVAVVTSLCSPRARRVGDILAGTVVVSDRARIPMPALAVAPPWLAGWVARLDLSGLTEELALPVRQYLTRFHGLTPQAQAELGNALVLAVCARLRVPPPAGYPPLQILGAVIAERQRRMLPAPRLPFRPVAAAGATGHPIA
ncbi:RDD family protein [Nocardia veterana]|uniref:RDD family protein n=1 Tax=Nocardia veterana TaxID=132249 RepID=A0A7X6LVR7_9NOCA|nr:RDD family protein [Nocardia veterana]NKY85498.1 RDD family protein [Nocardia veterana]